MPPAGFLEVVELQNPTQRAWQRRRHARNDLVGKASALRNSAPGRSPTHKVE
jgi:hypothetical protein